MYLEGLHGAISCGLSGWAILGSRVSYLFYHLESGGMCVDAESFDSFRSFVCKWIVYGSVGLCSGFLMKWIVGWYVLYSNPPPPSEVKKVISGRLPFFGASEWRFVHIEEQGWISGSSHAHRTSQHSAWGSEVCIWVEETDIIFSSASQLYRSPCGLQGQDYFPEEVLCAAEHRHRSAS